MKKIIYLFLLFALMVSCGVKINNQVKTTESIESKTESIVSELNRSDTVFLGSIIL